MLNELHLNDCIVWIILHEIALTVYLLKKNEFLGTMDFLVWFLF